jgi:UDP-N-acetylglucosamine--N-acetylmuramyl-(pentapeptide) pyrophosphoryl-undecaprenol N-acetylglucosamine transferase
VAKPVLLIPSPNVTANHQYHNAKALVDQQAAFLVQEQDLETDFEAIFSSIATDTKVQGKMRQALKKLAKPEAAKTIVEHLKTLLPHA